MNFTKTEIPDVILIEPSIMQDGSGYHFESFRQDLFEQNLGKINFLMETESLYENGVLKGLHYQLPPYEQTKLIRVISGEILDVAVDIREGSRYFGNYVRNILDSRDKKQLFIPKGFAHGFIVISDEAIVSTRADNYYSRFYERGIIYNDNYLHINWGFDSRRVKVHQDGIKLSTFVKAEVFSSEYVE